MDVLTGIILLIVAFFLFTEAGRVLLGTGVVIVGILLMIGMLGGCASFDERLDRDVAAAAAAWECDSPANEPDRELVCEKRRDQFATIYRSQLLSAYAPRESVSCLIVGNVVLCE